tara:strand:+ start:1093 stop:2760 length:1668 start_codon:yes stop_codon:yes gene_type:complete
MVLDRKMFRRPSATPPEKGPSSRGVGITSGLTQPVRGYKYGDFVETLESTSEELYPVLKKYFPEESFYERAGASPFQFFAALGTPMQPGQNVFGKIAEAGQYLKVAPKRDIARDLSTEIGIDVASKTLETTEDPLMKVWNTESNQYEYTPTSNVVANPNLYIAEAPEEAEYKPITVFDTVENKNVFIDEAKLSADKENRYVPEKEEEGPSPIMPVWNTKSKSWVYVSEDRLRNDMELDSDKQTYSPEAPDSSIGSIETVYDPILKSNIIIPKTKLGQILLTNPNRYEPKKEAEKDEDIQLKNVIDRTDPDNPVLRFATEEEILADQGVNLAPAISGQSFSVAKDGTVTFSTGVVGLEGADNKELNKEQAKTDNLLLRTNRLQTKVENAPESFFGISGGFREFYNNYMTQIPGIEFDEDLAEVRNYIMTQGQQLLREVSDDSRFTNEDRIYINKVTGVDALESLKSKEAVVSQLNQIQLLLEDRLIEQTGQKGQKPSFKMTGEDYKTSYLNYLKTTGQITDHEINPNIPTYTPDQILKRVEVYLPKLYPKLSQAIK